MRHFHPNKKYTTLAVYACVVLALFTVILVSMIRLPEILRWASALLSALYPLFYGFAFAYLLNPLVRLFERPFRNRIASQKKRRVLGIGLTYLLISVLLFLFFYLLFPLLLGDSKALGENMVQFLERTMGRLSEIAEEYGLHLSAETVKNALEQYFDVIVRFFSSFGAKFITTTYQFLFGGVLTVCILFYKEHILSSVRRIFCAFFPPRFCLISGRIARYSDTAFGSYVVGRIFETAIVGVANVIVYPIIGLPYPVLVSVIMTVTELIPVLGPLIGTASCVLIICTEAPIKVIWFGIATFLIQQLDNSFIGPKILGSAIGLKGIWIILSIAIGSGLFGMMGVLLAAPVFSVFYMLFRDFTNRRLRKKGCSTDTEEYTEMFASRVPQESVRKFSLFPKRKKKAAVQKKEEKEACLKVAPDPDDGFAEKEERHEKDQ